MLKGSFLINENAFKNWQFMVFMLGLGIFTIASAHSSDKKVMEIAKLNKEINALRSAFGDTRAISMKLKLESTIKNKVIAFGLKPGETPPQVIKVISKK